MALVNRTGLTKSWAQQPWTTDPGSSALGERTPRQLSSLPKPTALHDTPCRATKGRNHGPHALGEERRLHKQAVLTCLPLLVSGLRWVSRQTGPPVLHMCSALPACRLHLLKDTGQPPAAAVTLGASLWGAVHSSLSPGGLPELWPWC